MELVDVLRSLVESIEKEDIMKEKEQSIKIQAIHNSIRNNPETLNLTETQIRRLINLKLIAKGLPAQFQIEE